MIKTESAAFDVKNILNDLIQEEQREYSVRAITCLVVLEWLAPELQLAGLEFNAKLQEYRVTLKHYNQLIIDKKSASYVSKNAMLIKKLSPEDANRIGYMAGVNDTIQEYAI
ncbi:MAG: hypothetical protein K0U24_02180 [Gammaproteobacteria bacterium]|nr:hypothetical protein [Gammaproteobacteria bacterium]MCH9763033.1 hypothetical protein [Gammaproteobacteria bacterium]